MSHQDTENILDNSEFWKRLQNLFLFDKNTIFLKTTIEKCKKIISDDFHLFEEFSAFFEDAANCSMSSQMNII